MNVPNLRFDAEGDSARLPSIAPYGSRSVASAPYGESVNFSTQDEPTSEFRKSFFRYLGLALRYRWLIAVCCALSLAVGFVLTYTQIPIYQATVTVQIDRQAAKIVNVGGQQDPEYFGDDLRFYQTQYDLLRSRSLAERVATDLNLAAESDFLNPSSTAW